MSMATVTKEAGIVPISDAQDSEHFETELVNSVVGLLRAEAERRKFGITFYADDVRYSERGLIILPVTTDETRPIREESKMKRQLEAVWNEQQPPPARRVRLQYLWNPELSIRSTPPPLLNQAA